MNQSTQNHLLSIVQQNYSVIAAHYDETRKKKFGNSWNTLIKQTEWVKDGQSVLDAGCGNGRLLELFQNRNINYTGVDSSQELINLAKINYPQNIFSVTDLSDLSSLNNHKFDYIYSVAVFHHFPGKDLQLKVLRELKKHLGINGKLILTVWTWNQPKFRSLLFSLIIKKLIGINKMDFGDMLFDWKNQQGQVACLRYYHAFTACGLKKLARLAGFSRPEIIRDKFNLYLILTNES